MNYSKAIIIHNANFHILISQHRALQQRDIKCSMKITPLHSPAKFVTGKNPWRFWKWISASHSSGPALEPEPKCARVCARVCLGWCLGKWSVTTGLVCSCPFDAEVMLQDRHGTRASLAPASQQNNKHASQTNSCCHVVNGLRYTGWRPAEAFDLGVRGGGGEHTASTEGAGLQWRVGGGRALTQDEWWSLSVDRLEGRWGGCYLEVHGRVA